MLMLTGALVDIDIALADLPPRGPELGRGGEAAVYDLQPGLSLPDNPGPFVYKEYWKPRSAHGALRRVVALRANLSGDAGRLARLDAIAAWPVRQVVANGEAVGVLLPKIDDRFFCTILKPQSGVRDWVPAEVQFIFVPPDRALRFEYPLPSPQQRLRICRDFARAMVFFHDELDVVLGDVNAKNELIRLEAVPTGNPGAPPTVMVIDCDAVHPSGHVVQQMETRDWEVIPPEPMSRESDLYKLGLFVLRCLKPSDQPFYVRDPDLALGSGVLDATAMDLLRAAVGPVPSARPRAHRWDQHLSRLLGDVTDPARVLRAALRKTVTVPGAPVMLDWAAAAADVLEVEGAGCVPVSVDASSGVGSIELYPRETGRFTVRVSNAMPSHDVYETEPVAVLDLMPRVDLPVPVPTFEPPRLDTVALPDLVALYPAGQPTALPSVGDPTGWWTSSLPSISTPVPDLSWPDDLGIGIGPTAPDLLPLMTGGPDWFGDPYQRGEVIR